LLVVDAVPTIFNLPTHLVKTKKPRKPPRDRGASTSTCTDTPTTVNQTSHQLSSSNVGTEHQYNMSTPRKLKRQLEFTKTALDNTQKRLKVSHQRNRRLAVKVKSLQDLLVDLQQKQLLSQQAAENLSASFSTPAMELISRCLKKHSGETLKSYPPELRSFALTLQFYSSRAYNYVRETFGNCLPHPQTLSGWYKSVNGKPGFNDQVFAALVSKAQSSVSGRLLCSFMMDEVAIRKQLDYDTATDKFVGYVDMGVELDDMGGLPLAHEALVFMIVSLTESWKLPVAYFLIAGLNGSERANLVKLCLEKLYTVGVDIVSLTFDGSRANIAMADILGASITMHDMRPMFSHPCDPQWKVSIFLDACHMLKLMRNALADKSVLIDGDGNEIKWQYLKDLQELQSEEGLLAANKLNERHIQWTRQKMKVKLAAQTLSASVASALEFCNQHLNIAKFKDSGATVKFIRTLDRLFDVLNSRNPLAKGFKAPLRVGNECIWRPFLLSAVDYLKQLKLSNGQLVSESLRKTGVIGFVASATSIMQVFDTLVANHRHPVPMKYILSYKFSQDHLELFFAVIRSRGGSNNNPSPMQLVATWKRLLTHNQIKDVTTGNCIPIENCRLLDINFSLELLQKSANINIETISSFRRHSEDAVVQGDCSNDDHDYLPSVTTLSQFVDNVVVYIAGYVVKSLEAHIACEPCRESMIGVKMLDDVCRSDFGLLQLRDRGGLITPTADVIAVCKSAEHHIRHFIGPRHKPLIGSNVRARICHCVLTDFIGRNIFMSLAEHSLGMEPMSNHRVEMIRAVANKYITLRLHHQCKLHTRCVQGATCRSICTKTVQFKGQ